MNRTLISIAVIASLAGCASTPVMESVAEAHRDVEAQVSAAHAAADRTYAPIILPAQKVPYLPQQSVARGSFKAALPPVLRSTAPQHHASNMHMTVQDFARLLTEEYRLPVKVETGIQPGAPVAPAAPAAGGQGAAAQPAAAQASASPPPAEPRVDLSTLPPMPLRELISTVTRLLGTDWDWQDDTLLIQPTFTRTYGVSIAQHSTKRKSDIGKKGNSTAGVSGGAGGGVSGNFSNEITSSAEIDMDGWKDLEAALKQIAGDKKVVVGKSFNSVTVDCSKACHRTVKQFVDNINHISTAQVLFKVQEITVASSNTGESGVDWDMVYRTVLDSRKFRFQIATPASLVGSAAGMVQNILLPLDGVTPKNWDGSNVLYRAISTASKFVDVKPYMAVVANNENVTLTSIEQQSYTQSYTVVPSTVLGGAPAYVGNPGYATFGQILSVRPTIMPDGSIRVSFALDDTSGKINKGVGEGVIDAVLTNGANVNTTMIVKPGSTMILSAMKRSTKRTNNQGLLEGQRLGSEVASEDTTETVILVTPYIANVGAH
jgi:hypothetical protein